MPTRDQPPFLILTVGTGTAGAHSDVAAGLARTIDLVAPRRFWLVPSSSPLSLPVADIIRESVHAPSAFAPWSDTQAYAAIADPDDIHQCRAVIRDVIAAAKRLLQPGERLIINPTGGTKQMSAGATLAALDEEVGEIMFTTGERHQGVVKTGTEQPKSFSTEAFFLDRDLAQAAQLFAAGAFCAAARLLRGYPQPRAVVARETALCLHEWQRLNYEKAAAHAARFSADLSRQLESLAAADPFSAPRLGDLLAGAEHLQKWGDLEEALARYYRTAEQAAKVRLAEAFQLRPPYLLADLAQVLPPAHPLLQQLTATARGPSIQLGAQRAWEILEACQDPMANDYGQDRTLQAGLQRRNETLYGHGGSSVDAALVQSVADRLRRLLKAHLPAAAIGWAGDRRPAFPLSTELNV